MLLLTKINNEMRVKLKLISILIIFIVGGCKLSHSKLREYSEEEWSKRRWIQKAARTLRAGKELEEKQLNYIANLSKEEITKNLMSGEDFQTTIYHLNLYIQGALRGSGDFPPNFSEINDSSDFDDNPGAYIASKAILANGDYFQFLKFQQPRMLVIKGQGDQVSFQVAKSRVLALISQTQFQLQKSIISISQGCEIFFPISSDGSLDRDDEFFELEDYGLAFVGPNAVFGKFQSLCVVAQTTKAELIDELTQMEKFLTAVFDLADHHRENLSPNGGIDKLVNIDHLPVRSMGSPEALGRDFWENHTNSSTNFNRKRGSAILAKFLCDDLSPTNIDLDVKDHAKGAHASDPQCVSCHYKLDPMAGFFRYRGIGGGDFSFLRGKTISEYGKKIPTLANGPVFIFDDMRNYSQAEAEKYYKTWRSNDIWNVGHIRSQGQISQNFYSQNDVEPLADLFDYLYRSDDVKKCLVKRMAEFFISPKQTFDTRWLDQMGAQLASDAKTSPQNSAISVKKVIAKLITSQSFSHPDPDEASCYDSPSGSQPSPYCPVAAIVESKCLSCHNGSGQNNRVINFAQWVSDPTGKLTFSYTVNGQQLTRQESFALIRQRLQTKDRKLTMPKGKSMSDLDRDRFISWLATEMEN